MGKGMNAKTGQEAKRAVLNEALKMAEEDVETNRKIGAHGLKLFKDGDMVLTHCNAGSLATVAYGTALGVIRVLGNLANALV